MNEVTADGALYFSSAGNGGNLNAGTSSTWEGDFADGGASGGALGSGRLHSFGPQSYTALTSGPGNIPINLYWSDPLGGSGNDYDLFRLNSTGTIVLASSTNIQNGVQDPYEQLSGFGANTGHRVVIVKRTGAADRFLHVGAIGGALSIGTDGEVHGHAAAADAFAVAATPALAAFPQPFSSLNTVETFSSDGLRRLFYTADGTQYTPGNVSSTGGLLRQKPDLTAADGVSVTGAGGFPSPFFGTSAAAPHAAAIAGLLKSANGALTPADIRTFLDASAIDIGSPGVDRDSGVGIPMANELMLAAGVVGSAHLEVVDVLAFENPGDGNGAPEAGEGAYLELPIANYGGAQATAISATLTSTTPGITITQPAVRAYPDLPVSTTANAAAPFFFTIASNFPCPQAADFTLTVTSTGGPSPRVFDFQVPIGPPSYTITTTLDAVAPSPSPGVTTATGTQQRRLNRTGVPSSCGSAKPWPGLFGPNAARRYESYAFNTCTNSVPSCVTVTMDGQDAANLFSAAYSPTFVPGDLQQNYVADAGFSSSVTSYGFDLAGGAQTFVIDVHEVNAGAGVGTEYTLTVEGACGGSCAPPNQVPVAIAQNVTVVADQSGTAPASIDNGSFDPDGDPLTLTQDPPGPYPTGQTSVVLTATDPRGAMSQATATVTVLAPVPSISISDAAVVEGDLGTANADFVVTLSSASTDTVTVDYATADQTALSPADYVAASDTLMFLPGEVMKVVTVLVNGETVIEPDETLLVNLTAPTNATLFDAQGVGTITDDDAVIVDEATVTQAVSDGSGRVEALQQPDGGWFFQVGDTDCGAGPGVSCTNTVGITGLGLLAGYTRTGTEAFLDAATAAGDYLVARYNATIGAVPPVLPASQDVEFLVELELLGGDPLYSTTADDWFQRLVTAYPDAADRVDFLLADRGGLRTVAAWDVASLVRSAKAVGDMPYADAAAAQIVALEPQWKDVDPTHRFDQCPNPDGCGPPDNPFAFDYTLLAMGSLLNGFHDMPGYAAQITEYRDHLIAQQDPEDAWDVGDAQISAYVVLGLAAVGGPGTDVVIEDAVAWFLTNQLANGGWPAFATPTGQYGAEYSEVDAEAVRALFTLFNTPAGTSVSVEPGQLSEMTFSEVSTSGFTSVVATDGLAGVAVPRGFEILENLNGSCLADGVVAKVS